MPALIAKSRPADSRISPVPVRTDASASRLSSTRSPAPAVPAAACAASWRADWLRAPLAAPSSAPLVRAMFQVGTETRLASGLPSEALSSVRSPAARTTSDPASWPVPLAEGRLQPVPVRSQVLAMVRSPAAWTSTAGRTCTLVAAPASPRSPPTSDAASTAFIQAWLSAP